MEQGLLCFICGKYYDIVSLPGHILDCEKKRTVQIAKLRESIHGEKFGDFRNAGKTFNVRFHQFDGNIVQYNEEAQACFNRGLILCPSRRRHFHFERFELHWRACNVSTIEDMSITKMQRKTNGNLLYFVTYVESDTASIWLFHT